MQIPLDLPIHHQCAAVLAIAAGFLAGGIFSLLALDAVIEVLIGHEYTISHAMFVLGDAYGVVRHAWTFGWIAVILALRFHFWGWKL